MTHALRKPGIVALLIGTLCIVGCGPSQEQINMAKAMSARVDRDPTFNDSARFIKRYVDKNDNDYVMWSMEYASLCLMGGNYDAAEAQMLAAANDIARREDEASETAAAWGNEALKPFKGEPFERAMLMSYLGMLKYRDADYNNARIFFRQADQADSTTAPTWEEDEALTRMYRNDFRLAHFLLGKAFVRLGDEGNARVAFTKALEKTRREGGESEWDSTCKQHKSAMAKRIRLEKKSYQNATGEDAPVAGAIDMSSCMPISEMPAVLEESCEDCPVLYAPGSCEEMCSVEAQKNANLTLVVETGISPLKYLIGENGYMDKIQRSAYAERRAVVYIDGYRAGEAFRMLDLFHQADTRGFSEKDRTQIAKGVTQSILRRLPYIGSVAAYWDVRADHRYWKLLPGEVLVFTGRIKPGLHTVRIECFDANGNHLPRYRLTRHFVSVPDQGENLQLLHTYHEADNLYRQESK
jgi:tetratricopeptide (TPR) repeat protein